MDDAFVKQWLSDLRALLFDADDTLDLHNTLFLRPDPNPNPNRKRSWLALDRPLCHHRIGAQIAEIHKRLAEIAEGRKNFLLRPGDGRRRAPVGEGATVINLRAFLLVREPTTNVVGRAGIARGLRLSGS
uniref:Rx N-terminal domain-containing protein n=1 Tax=Ananas comosus var. bracteatus TaxID=296719 RepID=A0A6V7PDX0_ANACO|nr:unnamed protein product [Ananas comosus var. bracteatus]